ncbi:MAG: redoxin domain-containing protein [Myxococcota bacterium]
MRINPFFLLLPLSILACDADKDDDGDGLTNGEEEELGTDPESADSDGDGLSDGDEVNELNTDPLSQDSDTDGISDGDEVLGGTDPISADSDLDGIGDGVEMDAGSDPLNKFSWPGSIVDEQMALWPDFTPLAEAAGADGDTIAMDEVFPNFSGIDRYGNEVELYQFYGQVVLLDFSAGWCGPCRYVAQTAEDMFSDHRDDGLVIVHAMTSDNDNQFGVSDPDFIADWSDEYDLTFPVLEGDDIVDLMNDMLNDGFTAGWPTMMVIDQEMKIRYFYNSAGAEASIERAVEDLLESGAE